MTTPQSEIVKLYQNLDIKYRVKTNFTLGLGHAKQGPDINLAPDVQELLFFLNNQSFQSTDFDQRSLINIVLYDKATGAYVDGFAQDTNNYMDAFDKAALTTFLTKYS